MMKTKQNKIGLFKSPAIKKAYLICFIFILFLSFETRQAEANMFANAINKALSIFSNGTNTLALNTNPDKNTNAYTQNNNGAEDFVLKANTKNIVEKNSNEAKINTIKNGDVLTASVGPVRASTENEIIENDTIQVYEVKDNDTVADVAKLYDVSKNTIIWANDIKNGKLTPGDILLILPVSGLKHKIKKGDTVSSLAKKYNADEADISEFNSVKINDELAVGDEIIIPDGELYADSKTSNTNDKSKDEKNKDKKDNSKDQTKEKTKKKRRIYASAGNNYYTRPIIGGVKTQGLHGHNGIDIGAPIGSILLAAADGTVQVAKQSGYNGGYGNMIIISHPNGTQTLYAHMSSVYVFTGQTVSRGENIGLSGNSGKSTGPHLHFEVRGASNPF